MAGIASLLKEGRLVVDEPAELPAPPGAPGHLQPGDPRPRAISRDDLAPFAHDGEHLDRLLADSELVARLQANDFTGPDWDFVAVNAFFRYGLAVLTGWMRTGAIWDRVHKRCRIRLEPPPDWAWDDEAWQTVATDTLLEAIESFRATVLRTGTWDPTRKATLKTFFVGHCLWRFPNPYRRWLTATRARERERLCGDQEWEHVLHGQDRDIAAHVALRDQLSHELDGLDPRTRRVLELADAGFEQAEIAQRLGTSRKTVEMIVRNQAQRGRRRRGHSA